MAHCPKCGSIMIEKFSKRVNRGYKTIVPNKAYSLRMLICPHCTNKPNWKPQRAKVQNELHNELRKKAKEFRERMDSKEVGTEKHQAINSNSILLILFLTCVLLLLIVVLYLNY